MNEISYPTFKDPWWYRHFVCVQFNKIFVYCQPQKEEKTHPAHPLSCSERHRECAAQSVHATLEKQHHVILWQFHCVSVSYMDSERALAEKTSCLAPCLPYLVVQSRSKFAAYCLEPSPRLIAFKNLLPFQVKWEVKRGAESKHGQPKAERERGGCFQYYLN